MIVVDKMVNYRVVEPSVVVNWVFSMDGGVPDFHRSYVWTMLKSTIAKVNARVRGVTRKLQIARVADADGDEKMGSPVKPGAEDTPTEPLPLTGQASKTATLTAELEELEREKKQLFIDVFTKLLDLLVPAVGDSEKEESAFFRYGEGMLHELGRCVCWRSSVGLTFSHAITLLHIHFSFMPNSSRSRPHWTCSSFNLAVCTLTRVLACST